MPEVEISNAKEQNPRPAIRRWRNHSQAKTTFQENKGLPPNQGQGDASEGVRVKRVATPPPQRAAP